MENLNIYICENYITEYQEIIKTEKFNDVTVIPFISLCNNNKIDDNKI